MDGGREDHDWTSATTFSPDDTVTRGQLATFFHRYKGEPAVQLNPSTPGCPWDGSEYHFEFVREVDSIGVQVDFSTNGRFLAHPEGEAILSVDTLGYTTSVAPTESYEIVKVMDDGDVVVRNVVDGTGYRWDRETSQLEQITELRFIDISADGKTALFAWPAPAAKLLLIVHLGIEVVDEIELSVIPQMDRTSLSESGETIVLADGLDLWTVDVATGTDTNLGAHGSAFGLFLETNGEELVAALDLSQLLVSDAGVLEVLEPPAGVSVNTFGSISFAGAAPIAAATAITGGSFTRAASVWNYETGEVFYDSPTGGENSRVAGISADGRSVAFVSTVSRDVSHDGGAALYVMRIID